MSEPRIHMRHVRQASPRVALTCANGIRALCAQHGIDLRAFVRDGVPGEMALRNGGHFALTVLEIARKEAASNGQ